MSDYAFMSRESSERCATVLRALRRRFDLTLEDCVAAMGLPAGADATIARMENASNPWRYDRFDRFVNFAAPIVRMQPGALRACLLGDGDGSDLCDVIDWEYARLGSQAASRLLCRLECRWKPGSRWIIFFRFLPAFLLPEQAHAALDYRIPGRCDDTTGELSQVFEAMHSRFFLSDDSKRILLVLVPLPGALSLLTGREGAYRGWGADALAEVIEVLAFDCIDERGTAIAQTLEASNEDIFQDIDWLLVSDDLAIRHREGARVLDSIKIPSSSTDGDSRTVKLIRNLSHPAALRDDTRSSRSLLEHVLD